LGKGPTGRPVLRLENFLHTVAPALFELWLGFEKGDGDPETLAPSYLIKPTTTENGP